MTKMSTLVKREGERRFGDCAARIATQVLANHDWEYERLGAEHYAGVREFVRSAYDEKLRPKQDIELIGLFQADVASQTVLALYDLRSEGAFSPFPSVTVFCSQVESDGWLERYSAKALNSHALDASFLEEFEPIDIAYEERLSDFKRFRQRLVQSPGFPDIWQL